VTKRRWIDDKEFVEMLSISQSLPGLNATNMAILVGEKLRGWPGSLVAILGICLPGGALMYAVGVFYRLHGDHAWTTAGLKGVAAAAVGLILSTVVGLSRKALSDKFDFVFMAATVLAVNRLHWSVPRALILIGVVAVLFHYPRKAEKASDSQ
jgi:chromate transporter